MIFLDANHFLRYLVQPSTPDAQAMHNDADRLFAALQRGDHEVTTSEAIIAEVAYVLTSTNNYGIAPATAAVYLLPIVRLPGFKLPRGQRRRWIRALNLWPSDPTLGFVDLLTVASVEQLGSELATFDRHFNRLPTIRGHHPVHAAPSVD